MQCENHDNYLFQSGIAQTSDDHFSTTAINCKCYEGILESLKKHRRN